KLVASRPGSIEPLMLLARALIAAKDYDRAIDKLRDALLINPDLVEATREIMAIYVATGRQEQAAQEIKSLQRRRPNDSRGYVFEGDLLASQKKFAEAEVAYRNAQKRAPDDGAIAVKIYAASIAVGKTAAAEAGAEKWLKDHPTDVAMRSYLGERALVS